MQSYNQCAAHLGQVPPLPGLLFIIWNIQQLDHSPLRSLSTLKLIRLSSETAVPSKNLLKSLSM